MSRDPISRARSEQTRHERGAQTRRLRIIGGRWRGRRWQFPAGEIRPTSDRVRETLFNWLQGRIAGRRCLDLFAGSGALGLEALSRGAATCVFVDRDPQALATIGAVLREWGAEPELARLDGGSAEQFLARPGQRFDLVFLDPPFAGGAMASCVAGLEGGGWLGPGSLIYVEHPRGPAPAELPPSWTVLRTGTAGAVGYDLCEHRP